MLRLKRKKRKEWPFAIPWMRLRGGRLFEQKSAYFSGSLKKKLFTALVVHGRRKFCRHKFRRGKFRRISKSRNFVVGKFVVRKFVVRNFVVLIRITAFTKRYDSNYSII